MYECTKNKIYIDPVIYGTYTVYTKCHNKVEFLRQADVITRWQRRHEVVTMFCVCLWMLYTSCKTAFACRQTVKSHFESQREKCTVLHMRPTKLISACAATQSGKSSLYAWRHLKSLAIHMRPVKISITARMHRLVWIFARLICTKVRFLTLRLICFQSAQGHRGFRREGILIFNIYYRLTHTPPPTPLTHTHGLDNNEGQQMHWTI